MANVLETGMSYLQTQDPEVAACIENEFQRQKQNIELIASENIASPAVIAAMGSVLTNKYAEGYPGKRYYGGCDYVDVLETIAIERAKKLFGAAYANVQPHSGAQANLEVYAALLQPGDTLMGMDLASGGHLTHGARVNLSGKYYHSISYGVDPETGRIDYDQVEDMVRRYRPKLLVAGASAYPRAIDFKAFAEIAHKNGALLMVDMAHIAGLVAGGQHMSPVPYADVVTTTTHKTLRGPRGGMILSRDEQFGWFDPVNTIGLPYSLLLGRLIQPPIEKGIQNGRPQDNVQYSLDLPMEETFGVLTISPYSIIHMIAFPENYKKYIEGAFVSDLPMEELRKWERSYDYAVRKLTYIKKGKQLILKSPDNTARIRELWGMYPDARFINIHRDPYKTVRSTIHMFRTEMDSLRLTEEPDNIDELIENTVIDIFERMYRELFEQYYPGQGEMIADFWMPNKAWEGCDVDDPSARVLSNYGDSGK